VPAVPRRRALALAWSAVAGFALALLDSSPGFDATGITAVGLVATGAVGTLIDGSGALGMASIYAVVSAASIVLLERTAAAGIASLLFATLGAVGTAVLIRGFTPRRRMR
jgi:hypothetical protein